ncbi:hypothetical protein [Mycolicibacterium arenosum]|uniref:Uncharacterized protein n=1 Tax=Mycolicibacterium arenosum TaxID=2952157 RepID=A0ABT1M4A3_9MYCO|nr:hypothetical protein [Mycolicibacterium sp. CAU 1645]MCP9274001.1 hypothetical protein [Mycolicibacterium sp. CAU 1645]
MGAGLDEVIAPPSNVWAELARYLMAGDHRLGQAVAFLEEGGTDRNVFAERSGIKADYADFLLAFARKMKQGIIRVVVSDKNDGRESAAIQAHHYRYVLDDPLTSETRQYVKTVISRFRTVNVDIPSTAAKSQGAQDSYETALGFEPVLCTNSGCQWVWTRHAGECL